jgi:tetratricopeptide (TPR) repeat protein
VDTALVDRLKQRLETTSDTASASNWLITILGCRDTDKCSIPADVALDLLHTAMRNDRISGRARAAVLSTASNYYHNRLQRYDKAVQLARQAVREAPQRLLYRINLAALYIALTRYDEAQRELDKVKQTDWLGKHSLRIENLEEAIAARRTAAKAADENPRGR